MAESGGEGNIKVVVRCRPLNTRGPYLSLSLSLSRKPRLTPSAFLSYDDFCNPSGSDVTQSLLEARSLSSGCRGIKQSSTLQNQVLRKLRLLPAVQASAKLTILRLIRVTGRLGRGTNRDIVRKKHCIMIWALSYWSMDSQGSMRVFWPVSEPLFFSSALTNMCHGSMQTDKRVGSIAFCRQLELFIDFRLPQVLESRTGWSYRCEPACCFLTRSIPV